MIFISIGALLSVIFGLAVIAFGIWLLVVFWADFMGIIKGIVGLIVIFLGFGITTISYFVFQSSRNRYKIKIKG